ncbi:hypothetical protein AVEN_97693-1 [Araneus ventricosus]|uniref:Uncharacterized protein n=1 Tax=Araneus ventricosus TaxID=182803 RepID=A0A4Y2PQJ5_ARAVE|nr:hypothetical protein AVEN_97693-1 [Araneus ventricosus]
MIQTFELESLYSSRTGLSSTSVSESVSRSLCSVTSPSRHTASDSSSAGAFLPNSSKTAEYCSVGIISRCFGTARLGYGERFKRHQAQLSESLSVKVIGASRRMLIRG